MVVEKSLKKPRAAVAAFGFSPKARLTGSWGLTGAVFFPPSFAEDPKRVRPKDRIRRKKANSHRPGLRFSPGLKVGPSGLDEGNDDNAPSSGSVAKLSQSSGKCSQSSQGLGSSPFAQPSCVSRTKPRVRSKRPPTDLFPEHVLLRQVRCRLRLWKRLREVLVHHSCIPEDEESLLIELAEQEGVKDNEDGLEGWVAFQLLNKVSEQATTGFEILTLAVEDIIDQLSSKGTRTLTVRSSNITQWRPEVQKWIQAQTDDVLLLQETHLNSSATPRAVAAVRKAGYEMFRGEAAPGRKGTHGGVAVLARSHLQARTTFHYTEEGCGFFFSQSQNPGHQPAPGQFVPEVLNPSPQRPQRFHLGEAGFQSQEPSWTLACSWRFLMSSRMSWQPLPFLAKLRAGSSAWARPPPKEVRNLILPSPVMALRAASQLL